MNANAYEILALAMRYVFAALMVLIVLRGWRITIIDSRRATKLRRLSPETGIIGQMLVVDGGERAKPGMKYQLTLEGTVGASRRADIRVRHSSVRGRHAYYQMTDEGLFVRGHANARIALDGKPPARELMLCDGDVLRIGGVRLMLVLFGGGSTPEEISRNVRSRRRGARRRPEVPDFDDGIFDPLAGGILDSPEEWDEFDASDGFDPFAAGDGFDDFDEFDGFDEFDDFDQKREGRRRK